MNKDEFNKLDINKQVEYINKGLESYSLTKVCASIGIDRSTVRKRFQNKGYELIDNKYIQTTINIINTEKTNTINTKTTEDKKVVNNTKVLEQKIKSLELEIQGIKDILDKVIEKNTKKLSEVKEYEGTEVVRSYRINEEVQKEWKVFCKAHSEYKVGDLLANAMVEYMNKVK